MSKASRPQDLRNHAHEPGAIRLNGWCSGCGLHKHVTGEHRADCTATYEPDCEHCLYYPNLHGQHRADCPTGTRRPHHTSVNYPSRSGTLTRVGESCPQPGNASG